MELVIDLKEIYSFIESYLVCKSKRNS